MSITNKIKPIVDHLINQKPILMDRFDGNYLSDFHHILRENYGIEDINNPQIAELVKLTGLSSKSHISDLTLKLLELLDENDYLPACSTLDVKKHHKYMDSTKLESSRKC